MPERKRRITEGWTGTSKLKSLHEFVKSSGGGPGRNMASGKERISGTENGKRGVRNTPESDLCDWWPSMLFNEPRNTKEGKVWWQLEPTEFGVS